MAAPKTPVRPRKRNGIAAALKAFIPKSVPPKKGGKAYTRKLKNKKRAET